MTINFFFFLPTSTFFFFFQLFFSSFFSSSHCDGVNYSYPFNTLYQDRFRIATIGLIRVMMQSFPSIFLNLNVPIVQWPPDASLRLEQVLKQAFKRKPLIKYSQYQEEWRMISNSIHRDVTECHMKVREHLRNRCLSLCCNALTSSTPSTLIVAKHTFATLIVSTQDKGK